MRDDDYIKMCITDFSANSRQTNDNTTVGLIICGIIIIACLCLAIFAK